MFKNNRSLLTHSGYHSTSLDVMLVGVFLIFCTFFVSVSRYKPQAFPAMTNQVQFQDTFAQAKPHTP